MSEPVEPALEASVLADADTARVYADWLQQRGVARGELMAIQLAREARPADSALAAAEAAVRQRHAKQLLGPLERWVSRNPTERLDLTWRRGFIVAASVGFHSGKAALAALLRHPSGRQLREVSIGRPGMAYRGTAFNSGAILELLLSASPAPPLRALAMHLSDTDRAASLGDLDGLGTVYPRLEDIALVGRVDLRDIALPNARRFALRTRVMMRPTLDAIAEADWPALVELDLDLGSRSGYDLDAAALAPLLAGHRVPCLRVLRLDMTDVDALCERLVASPLAGRLEVLQLSGHTGMSDRGLARLAAHASELSSLRQLAIRRATAYPVGRAALLEAGLPVVEI